jgi:hypothetical protein
VRINCSRRISYSEETIAAKLGWKTFLSTKAETVLAALCADKIPRPPNAYQKPCLPYKCDGGVILTSYFDLELRRITQGVLPSRLKKHFEKKRKDKEYKKNRDKMKENAEINKDVNFYSQPSSQTRLFYTLFL